MTGTGKAIDRNPSRATRPVRMRCWRDAADDALSRVLQNGRDNIRKARQRARLLADDLASGSAREVEGAARARLESALAAERRRGLARHWTYDFNRHLALLQALAALDEATGGGSE